MLTTRPGAGALTPYAARVSACAHAEAVGTTAAAGAARLAGGFGVVAGPSLVIFLGATAPEASWPVWSVLVLGAVTGGVADGLLGVVSGWFLPSLAGVAGGNRTGRHWRTA